MILKIDTTQNNMINIWLLDGDGGLLRSVEIEAKHAQAERLLPGVNQLLLDAGRTLEDIEKIVVVNAGDGFTSLRIGIIVANTLAYALNVPVEGTSGEVLRKEGVMVVAPEYSREPNVG